MSRIWKYKESQIPEISQELTTAAGGIPILAKLLAIRGVTDPEKAKAFLNLSNYRPTSSATLPDIEKAIARIEKAIQKQEHVLIYGDFDVDGITGTSVLLQSLKYLKANVSYYVPNRHTEGHGLNSTALCRLVSSRQVKLIVTTDTGITNFNEVNLLKSLNVDTIITDHHELPEHLPQALAILCPKLLPSNSPLLFLAGVGIAYKLCEALLEKFEAPQSVIDSLLDLVAIGTVVDMVPMLQENRYLVWRGLDLLSRRERTGLNAIFLEANIDEGAPISTQTLGFVIGPRLNAIGRIADANEAVELLTTSDPVLAKQLASKFEQCNRKRKDMVDECLLQVEKHLVRSGELSGEKAVILASSSWNQGIVGLVATRLVEKYHRPCFIGCIDSDSEEIRFSARSIEGFNMHENLLELEHMFIRWGGHSGAAGFSIAQKDLSQLKAKLFKLCNERIRDEQLNPIIWLDMKLAPSQVNPHLVELINRMAPFGQDNPMPIFGLENASIGAQRFMGENQRHLKLVLTNGNPGQYLEAIHWNYGENRPKLNPASTYRFAFAVEMNTYNGTSKTQLLLKDLQDEACHNAPDVHPKAISKEINNSEAKVESLQSNVIQAEAFSLEQQFGPFHWIDHRKRDEIESFLSQILASVKGASALEEDYRIFCEGTQQFLPVPMTEALFCKRNGSSPEQPSRNLVLWDLPPDMASLVQLLRTQKPEVIHLFGGKYRKIPICRPYPDYLEGLNKVLQKLWKEHSAESMTLELQRLAMMLSTTPRAILAGLGLLNRLGVATTRALPKEGRINVTLVSATGSLNKPLSELVEFISFQDAVDEVHRFREWLMVAPLSVIQSTVSLEVSSGITTLREERSPHVLNIH